MKIFRDKNKIEVPDMNHEINAIGTSTSRKQKVTNMNFYHVEVFLVATTTILLEMNISELLVCMDSLNLRNNFF